MIVISLLLFKKEEDDIYLLVAIEQKHACLFLHHF